MKSRNLNRLRRSLCQLASLGILAAVTCSCSTSREVDSSPHVVPKMSKGWVKVSSEPPTWYPRGAAANHPTDYRGGEWIYLKDTADTRFFIPLHGLLPEKRKPLQAEAMAARHPDLIKNEKNEDIAQTAKGVGGGFILAIGHVMLNIFTGGMVGLY
ncbi:hypothetical protein N8662_02825 [Akkermansiaceae bacterium]|nr:hypothetical protein [bacterium]MDA7631092.1 hypothetical protein [Akkermansiaceae bacterium]MDB4641448.1 hypothetical protein [Akkermansiaceae bacterium]MDB4782893.1 hypothetical protein [Akkermansiaceae bacterium]